MITQSTLKELVNYDQETGAFVRLSFSGGRVAGSVVGSPHCAGYLQCSLLGNKYLMHRLAWLYVYGVTPDCEIDHVNGVRNDNRLVNLRLATSKQNKENVDVRTDSNSGYRGVSWHSRVGKWRATVGHNGKQLHIGYFSSAEIAADAAMKARIELFTHHRKLTIAPQPEAAPVADTPDWMK